jgi:hypothetical protein
VTDSYYLILHPTTWQHIATSEVRWRWELAYRSWRELGKPEMSLREVFEKHEPGTLINGTLGQICNFNFVLSEEIQ